MKFSGKLNRIELLVALVVVGLLSFFVQRGITATGVAQPSSTGELLTNIMVGHSVVALICLPFFACRLRDLGWPTILSAFPFVPLVPQSLFMFHLRTGGEHAGYQPATYLTAINYADLSVLAFAVLLMLWPGRRLLDDARS